MFSKTLSLKLSEYATDLVKFVVVLLLLLFCNNRAPHTSQSYIAVHGKVGLWGNVTEVGLLAQSLCICIWDP